MNTIHFYSKSKNLLILLLLVGMTAFFNSCVKEEDFGKDTILLPTPKKLVTTNIFGLVVDEADNPMADSEVLLKTDVGFEATTTDENGNFLYRNVRVASDGAFIKVRQMGKFEGFRKMNVTPDSYNYTKIKLLDKTIVGTISSSTGGAVSHPSTAKLELLSNSVRYENGGDYTGNVNVAMSWIDPTASDLPARIVGDLSGVDIEGNEVLLGTYGMLNVELLADNGEELQLKDGSPATLSFPVPAEIRDNAPSTIPLWSYNEDLGVWLEEGSATLQGGYYVGDVAHFSSWNCDYKGERISVTGKVISRNTSGEDVVMPFLQIYVDVEDILRRGGFLDSSGEFEFYNFPANEVFTITILDRCDNVIFEQQYEPYANDTDLGTIVVQGADTDFVMVTGSATDCNDALITEGYIDFELDDLHFIYPLEEDGTFEFAVNVCDETSGEISVIDVANVKASPIQTLDLTNNPVDAGILKACDELPQFLNTVADGTPYRLFVNVSVTFGTPNGQVGDDMFIYADESEPDLNNYYYANISVDDVTSIGTYNNVRGYFGAETSEKFYELIPASTTLEITQYGENAGDLIRGTFSGQANYTDQGMTTQVPVSGEFKVVRQ